MSLPPPPHPPPPRGWEAFSRELPLTKGVEDEEEVVVIKKNKTLSLPVYSNKCVVLKCTAFEYANAKAS